MGEIDQTQIVVPHLPAHALYMLTQTETPLERLNWHVQFHRLTVQAALDTLNLLLWIEYLWIIDVVQDAIRPYSWCSYTTLSQCSSSKSMCISCCGMELQYFSQLIWQRIRLKECYNLSCMPSDI